MLYALESKEQIGDMCKASEVKTVIPVVGDLENF